MNIVNHRIFIYFFSVIAFNSEFKWMGAVGQKGKEKPKGKPKDNVKEKVDVKVQTPVQDTVLPEQFALTSPGDVEPDIISATFYMRIDVGPSFDSVKSGQLILQGKRCYVQVSKGKKDNIDYLRIFLWIFGEDLRIDVGRKVDATFKLVSTVQSYTVVMNEFEWNWRAPQSFGYNNFLPWADLHNPARGFVTNHKALLKITLNVNDPFLVDYK